TLDQKAIAQKVARTEGHAASLSGPFFSGALDAVAIHPIHQRAACDAEHLGGLFLVAAALLERSLDARAFALGIAGGIVGRKLGSRRLCRATGGEQELIGSDRAAFRDEDRALHRAPQLSHVAGPAVALEESDGFRRQRDLWFAG